MGREIKFRCYSSFFEQIFEVGTQPLLDDMIFSFTTTGLKLEILQIKWKNNGDGPQEYHEWITDEKAIFPQYTGFKDSRGIEIYEGDILIDSKDQRFEVVYREGWGQFSIVNKRVAEEIWIISTREVIVIGNIYQNPELLTF